ncbi:hypothetical protein [Spirillospora sp. CA-128828]|uniref:hypothetical protein n=1 Tax=Spirillospora sp. CA-128828 TaxID=3240033 RepID=UPI003D8A5060
MAAHVVYLDPPPHSWRSRKISIRPARWYVVVELDRDGYVDTLDGDAEKALPPGFVDAAERLRSACIERIWLDGYSGGFTYGDDDRSVTLFVQYTYADDTVEALCAAELDGDFSKLDALATKLALPVDDWLAPGERLLRRGVDFDARPSTFLRFLRAKARNEGLRLNGRATPEGVWVRPQLSATGRLQRMTFPEQYVDRPDRWTGAAPAEGPWRPYETRVREQDFSKDASPVEFRQVSARPKSHCPCGFRNAFSEHGIDHHEAQHQLWSVGLRMPRNLSWGFGDVAVVTTRSSVRWQRLAAQIAQAPRRENGYDFPTWEVGERPQSNEGKRRAYLLRFREYVIGYLVAEDRDDHYRWDFESEVTVTTKDKTRRPSIDLIWVAAVHRGRGVGGALVQCLADDFGCPVSEVSWSTPVSAAGQRLARRLAPDGIWVH